MPENKHLLFWVGDQLVGTMEAPECFRPTNEFLEAALDLGVRIGVSYWPVPEGLESAGWGIFDNISAHAKALRERTW